MLKIPKFMLDLRQLALVASFLCFFHISVKVYQKKIMQLFAMLSCIIYYIYPFTFFVPINNRLLAVECYLSCIIALKNSQVRSDLRNHIFHSWEIARKTIHSSGIQILSPGQTRKHCCGNIVSCQCFAMFPRVGKH